MTAHEAALTTLAEINNRVWAAKKRSEVAAMENTAEWESITAERFAIRDAAKAHGFIRIFDGSYKLSKVPA